MPDPDLIIVGAGAAGLAAAKAARARGLETVVLEAKGRIGGRCVGDRLAGIPWERGANWIHGAEHNPFVHDAKAAGFTLETENQGRRVWSGGGWSDQVKREAYAYFDQTFAAIDRAGEDGLDVPASSVVPAHPRFRAMFDSWFASLSGVEPERTSTLDSIRYREGRLHFRVEAGYGALLAHFAGGLPVETETPVEEIDWSGSGIVVTTPRGRLQAKAAVVTPSTNVLAAGGIRFKPSLPLPFQQAFEAVPVGEANKVALAFGSDVFGTGPCMAHYEHASMEATRFELSPFGRPLAIAHFGGRFAAEIEAGGPKAMIDFALARLTQMIGAHIKRHLIGTAATGWCRDPHILGGYSQAKPGFARAREVFAEPVADRLMFAGEATSIDAYGTVHGARASGEAAVVKLAPLLA